MSTIIKLKKQYSVMVLLATHNGGMFLTEQLESIYNQKWVCVSVFACDDSSSDNTCDILREYEEKYNLVWCSGKFGSAQKNFYNLVDLARDADYYAFADQDDYWDDDKLYRAINELNKYEDKPCLYYSVSRPADENLQPLNRRLYRHHKVHTFGRAIVATNSQGSTMVFNKKLCQIIKKKKTNTDIMHDGWIHKTCLAVGGDVLFDETPCMLYRQHANNVVAPLGKEKGLFDKVVRRLKWFFDVKEEKILSTLCDEWLENYDELLTNEAKELINLILDSASFKTRLKILKDKRIYSEYRMDYFRFLYLLFRKRI